MHVYKKYDMVMLCLVQYIACSFGQYLLKSFHKLSSQDQLESNICNLYTPTRNISSSVQCAKKCADIHCCSSYGYDKSYIPALSNCAEIYKYGEMCSRVYNLKVSGQSFDVFCDMHTSGGGWTVFQRRQDGSVSFARNWAGYKQGFGNLTGEHWLGNDVLDLMTAPGTYRLRVDLESFGAETRYAEYENFRVADESQNYKLTVGNEGINNFWYRKGYQFLDVWYMKGLSLRVFDIWKSGLHGLFNIIGPYSGTAGEDGNGLFYINEMQFGTIDRDNDKSPDNCAIKGGGNGGFWYNWCDAANPNGVYRYAEMEDHHGINWYPWLKYITLKRVEMKFRPNDFTS